MNRTRSTNLADATAPLAGVEVLVVESDYAVALQLNDALQHAGADVVGPISLAENALRLIVARTLRCALLDVAMLSTIGYNIAFALRDNGTPFAFLSSEVVSEIPAELEDVKRVQKPLSATVAVATVLALLETPRASQANK